MWNEFEDNIKDGHWRKALKVLLSIAESYSKELKWDKQWIKRIYLIKKVGIQKGEKDKAIVLCERALSYTRKILIEARLHGEARALYIHQMKFRRWIKLRNKDYVEWFLNLFYWILAGYKKSYIGLFRFFIFISIIVLGTFAFLYSFPTPKIEYVSDPSIQLTWVHYLYFSGMALTTVGYGDIHPKPDDKFALMLSVVEAIFGYILLGTFVAFLITIEEPVDAPTADWKKDLFSQLP
jgi:hypothetical protein